MEHQSEQRYQNHSPAQAGERSQETRYQRADPDQRRELEDAHSLPRTQACTTVEISEKRQQALQKLTL
jgi:hypothetical protein